MPEFVNDTLKCKFKVPDRPTVREQLAWYSKLGFGKQPSHEQCWDAARAVISEWECEAMPDPEVDLDAISNPTQTRIVLWAGSQVLVWMNDLQDLPKN